MKITIEHYEEKYIIETEYDDVSVEDMINYFNKIGFFAGFQIKVEEKFETEQ